MKFNDIANAISVISGVTLAGIVGVGVYTYANKDAIIDGIKEAAIESVICLLYTSPSPRDRG